MKLDKEKVLADAKQVFLTVADAATKTEGLTNEQMVEKLLSHIVGLTAASTMLQSGLEFAGFPAEAVEQLKHAGESLGRSMGDSVAKDVAARQQLN